MDFDRYVYSALYEGYKSIYIYNLSIYLYIIYIYVYLYAHIMYYVWGLYAFHLSNMAMRHIHMVNHQSDYIEHVPAISDCQRVYTYANGYIT